MAASCCTHWMFEGRSAAESHTFETEHFSTIGALIIGRRMADLGIGPWGEEPTFHAPVFVVTHRPAETIVKEGGTSYVFVTEGIDAALLRARKAARVRRRAGQRRRGHGPPIPRGQRD